MNEKPTLLTYDEAKAQGLWFMSKRFGYGWVPISWQGWLVTLGAVALMVAEAIRTIWSYEPTNSELVEFAVVVVLLIVLLIAICTKTGEKAYWRWGK